MMHMYIHDNLIPKMLEVETNGKTKAKLLEIIVSQRHVRIQYESG